MLPADTPGLPYWVELDTAQPQVSLDFYAALFGWSYLDGGNGYVVATMDGLPVAGITPGGSAAWTLYLGVHNTANTAERAQQLGGRIIAPPQPMRTGDLSVLVVADPGEAPVGFLTQTEGWQFAIDRPGGFTWAELYTWYPNEVDQFYRALFNYDQEQVGDGVVTDYTSWSLHGTQLLGRLRMGDEFAPDYPPHWMVYFTLDPALGADEAAELTLRVGGRVQVEPFDTPYGRTTVLLDPNGTVFTAVDGTRRIAVVAEEVIGAPIDDPYDD